MSAVIVPVIFCVLLWWLGTGLVLRLDNLPESTYRNNRLKFTLLAGMIALALLAFRESNSLWSAYFGFAAAIILWGWLEFLHYSGYLVGPRVNDCPPGLSAGKRFVCAVEAMLYREVAVAAVGIGLLLVSWGSPNKTALYAYTVLWAMRVSAELNVFFGVGYLPEHWLPEKLKYLMTYRSRRKNNAFFPVSVLLACAVSIWIFLQVPAPATDLYGHTSALLIGTLLCLAIVEHLLLVVPNNGAALWLWAHSGRAT